MKAEITESGAFDADGKELEVGAVVNVKGDELPGWLVGKARAVTAVASRAAMTNPAKAADTVAGSGGNDTVAGGQ